MRYSELSRDSQRFTRAGSHGNTWAEERSTGMGLLPTAGVADSQSVIRPLKLLPNLGGSRGGKFCVEKKSSASSDL